MVFNKQFPTASAAAACSEVHESFSAAEGAASELMKRPQRPGAVAAAAAASAQVQAVQQRRRRHSQQQQQSLQRNHHSPSLALALCTYVLLSSIFCACIPSAAALACYETVNGKTTIVQNDAWTYCALVPATKVGNELVNGSQFGLGPENDMLAAYNSAFAMSVDEYRILTVCIYERYDFSRFLVTIKPDVAVEFAFRCVCNYDLCNSEPTFSAYLSAIKSESFARR